MDELSKNGMCLKLIALAFKTIRFGLVGILNDFHFQRCQLILQAVHKLYPTKVQIDIQGLMETEFEIQLNQLKAVRESLDISIQLMLLSMT